MARLVLIHPIGHHLALVKHMMFFERLKTIYQNLLSTHQTGVWLFAGVLILSASLAQAQNLINPDAPQGAQGKYITYGFEAEFRGTNAAEFVTPTHSNPDAVTGAAVSVYQARTDKYPFLDFQADMEASTNFEIRSLGGERKLSEVIQQMNLVKSDLKGDLRGFHMHIRIPKEIIKQHQPITLKSWMHYLGDIVFTWRIQNKNPYLSLNSYSLARKAAINLEDRGPVRLTTLPNGDWDFEIRGFMTSTENIQSMAQTFVTGLMNPDMIRPDAYSQINRSLSQKSMLQNIEELIERQKLPALNPEQLLEIRRMEGAVTYRGLLPVYDFKNMAGVTAAERSRIELADEIFYKDVYDLFSPEGATSKKVGPEFNELVKKWTLSVDLNSILKKNVFFDPSLKHLIQKQEAANLEIFKKDLHSSIEDKANIAAVVVLSEKNPYALEFARNTVKSSSVDARIKPAADFLADHGTIEDVEILKEKLARLQLDSSDSFQVKTLKERIVQNLVQMNFPEKAQFLTSLYLNNIGSYSVYMGISYQSSDIVDYFVTHALEKNSNIEKTPSHLLAVRNTPTETVRKYLHRLYGVPNNNLLHKYVLQGLSSFKDKASIDLMLSSVRKPDFQKEATEYLFKMVGRTKAKLLLERVPLTGEASDIKNQAAKRDLLNKKGTLLKSPSKIQNSCEKLF